MMFGPDGDPIPPQVFNAAAVERPDAGIRLREGVQVPAGRIAAVLAAQIGGRFGAGQDGDHAWIEAMLGVGPRPDTVSEEDLPAEDCVVEVIAFGKELMITPPTGATFLLTEARSRAPESVCLRLADGGPIAPAELVARLLAGTGEASTGSTPANPGKASLPHCKARLEDQSLVIELPTIGALHLARGVDDAASGPLASMFMSGGETASMDDLMHALRPPVDPTTATRSHASMTPSYDVEQERSHPVPLKIDLPDALAAAPARVALVMVRGLPEGAGLSAGVESGDGSWLLSPRNLSGLALTPPPGQTADFALDVVAITVANYEGELTSASNSVLVPLQSAESETAPIALGLDPQVLNEDGPFDAFIVRGVPAGTTLSAGTYDAAIDGWVLLPHHLNDVSVMPAGGQSEDFTLKLLGVCLQPGGRARPRVVAQVAVTIG